MADDPNFNNRFQLPIFDRMFQYPKIDKLHYLVISYHISQIKKAAAMKVV